MAHDRTSWIKGEQGEHIVKGKKYKNLTQFTRMCATCGEPFSIYVTPKIACGQSDSNNFGIKNCEKHRRSRTLVDSTEVDALRMANSVMREELNGLYRQVTELTNRLSKYELQPAMNNVAMHSKMPWE